jgi:hypothetical protein
VSFSTNSLSLSLSFSFFFFGLFLNVVRLILHRLVFLSLLILFCYILKWALSYILYAVEHRIYIKKNFIIIILIRPIKYEFLTSEPKGIHISSTGRLSIACKAFTKVSHGKSA